MTRWLIGLILLAFARLSSAQSCLPLANCVTSPIPSTQTIASGSIITANACGGLKRVSSAGSVTTSTTDTFTAPSVGNINCWMAVCNVGANAITLDNNARFKSAAAGDVVLGADDCVSVVSTGGIWYQVSALLAN